MTLEATVLIIRDFCSFQVSSEVREFCLYTGYEDLMAKFVGTLHFEQYQPRDQWEMDQPDNREATRAAWDKVVVSSWIGSWLQE